MSISSISIMNYASQAQKSGMQGRELDPSEFASKIMEKDDADGDGYITLEESGKDEEFFNKIDADGDGRINLEELEQAHEKMEAMRSEMEARMPQSAMQDSTDTTTSLLELINSQENTTEYSLQSLISSYQAGNFVDVTA